MARTSSVSRQAFSDNVSPSSPDRADPPATTPPAVTPSAAFSLSAVVLIAAVLRFADIGGKSIWLDEAFSIALARASWTGFVHMLRTQEANMSLYYLLLRAWLSMGQDEATIRALSAIFGTLTIPVVYALGSYLFNKRAGVCAALFLAIDPMQLWAAQEARGYSLAVFLISCSTWAFAHIVGAGAPERALRAGSSSASGRSGPGSRTFWWAALYACTSALALYAHFYCAFVLLAQWLSLAGRPRWGRGEGWWGQLLASAAAAGLLLVPLMLFFLRGPHGNIEWLGDALRTGIPRTLMAAHTVGGFVGIIGYGGAIIAVIIAAAATLRRDGTAHYWGRLLVLLWVAIPVAIPLAITILLKPVLDPRYLVVCIPGFALTAAAMVATRRRPGALAWAALVTIVLFEGAGDWGYFAGVRKEDWRDATRDLLADARQGDVAMFYAPYVRRPFDYYAGQSGRSHPDPVILYPDTTYADFQTTRPAGTLTSAVDQARATALRTWVVLSHHTGAPDSACAGALDAALRSAFSDMEQRDYPTVTVRLYRRAASSTTAADAGILPPTDATVARACPQN